ncbi:zinc-ribbon domain-containing protein [Halobacteria archaeon AArc-curdl1]|uniref:Zinc-ribbon domain-containing protein n=1 Tax=Natronosalvus hydrolyticus TaxID=2979988 RepID=A0AAP2ZDE3_9EURY|nr:zinc-ribbon domain-containing protein [Halobacteria archaeon AArc-curdl1]
MKFCFACGEEIPEQANFCPECGADLSVLQDGSDDGGTEDGEMPIEGESSAEGENQGRSAVDTDTESTSSGDAGTEPESVEETSSQVEEPTEPELEEDAPTEPELESETTTEPEPEEESVSTDATTVTTSSPDRDAASTGDEGTDSTGDSASAEAAEPTAETTPEDDTDESETNSSGPRFTYNDSSSGADEISSSDEDGASSSDLEETPPDDASEGEADGEGLDDTESVAQDAKEPIGAAASDERPQWVVDEESNSSENETADAENGDSSEDTNTGTGTDVAESEQHGESRDGYATQPAVEEPEQPTRADQGPEPSEQARTTGPEDNADLEPSQPAQETPSGARETSNESIDSSERRPPQGPAQPPERAAEPQPGERSTPRFARPGEEPSKTQQSAGGAQQKRDTPPQSAGSTPTQTSSSPDTTDTAADDDDRHPAVTGAIVGIGAFGVSYLATYLALVIDFLALSDVEASVGDLVPTSGVSVPGSEYGLNAPIEMSVWEFVLWMLYGSLDIGLGVDSTASVQEMSSSIDPFAAVDAFLTTSLYTVAVLLVLAAAGVVTVLLVSKERDVPLELADGAIAGGAVAVGFGAVAVASTFVIGFGGDGLSVQPGLEATAINAVLFGAVAGGIGGAAGSYLFTADDSSNEGAVVSTQQPAQPTQTRPPERSGRSGDQKAQSPERGHPSSAQAGPQREQPSTADETEGETQSQRERSPPRFEKPKSGE